MNSCWTAELGTEGVAVPSVEPRLVGGAGGIGAPDGVLSDCVEGVSLVVGTGIPGIPPGTKLSK